MKKKKLTINTLAMGNLKSRKKQYTILIIGIILAMVFSSGVPFFLSCMQTSITETQNRLLGTQDEIILNATDIDFENGEISDYISEYSFAHTIGFAYKDEEKNDIGSAVAWLDEKAQQMYYPFLYEGRMPENEGEIAAEKQTLMQLGLADKQLGEEITLNMKIPDGKDFSEKTEKRTYTLVGIVCNKKNSICEWYDSNVSAYLPALFVNKGEETALGGRELLVAFVNLKESEAWSTERWNDYSNTVEDAFTITTSYRYDYTVDGTDGTDIFNTLIYSTAFAVMLTLVSCLVIVNSFSNNLRQRKRQIGMLRAVGATKRQIVSIYTREAFIISIISAPVSLFISYFGVKLMTKIVGDDLIFMPRVWILFAGAAFGIICVMSAALIPVSSISKSSPMQAIRNIDYSRKMRKKKIRSQKFFSVSSLIAKRNITLARSRQIVVSIILSITIVVSCYGFSVIEHEMNQTGYGNYEYSLYNDANFTGDFDNATLDFRGFSDNDIAEIMSTGYFSEVLAFKSCVANILTDELTDYELLLHGADIYEDSDEGLTKENFKEKLTEKFSKKYLKAKEKYDYDSLILSSTFVSMDEAYFELLKKNVVASEINLDKINSGEEIVLVAPQKIGAVFDSLDDGYTFFKIYSIDGSDADATEREYIETQECSFKVGDTLELSIVCTSMKDEKQVVKTDRNVKIGAIISEVPDELIGSFLYIENIGIITTNAASGLFAPEVDYESIHLKTKSKLDDETDSVIASYLEYISSTLPDGRFRNRYESARDQEKSVRVVLLAMVCIIAFCLAVCASVINNTLVARIYEGKKEIGTLRAVGADLKVISSLYIKQLLSVFGRGYGVGFGIYLGCYGLFAFLNKVMEWGKELFAAKVFETALMCAIMFFVGAVNLIIKIKQEMKHSIVENIKEL